MEKNYNLQLMFQLATGVFQLTTGVFQLTTGVTIYPYIIKK